MTRVPHNNERPVLILVYGRLNHSAHLSWSAQAWARDTEVGVLHCFPPSVGLLVWAQAQDSWLGLVVWEEGCPSMVLSLEAWFRIFGLGRWIWVCGGGSSLFFFQPRV